MYASNFCKAARDLDARLLALGAQRVCERGENDDDNYRPEVYAKWKDALWMVHSQQSLVLVAFYSRFRVKGLGFSGFLFIVGTILG